VQQSFPVVIRKRDDFDVGIIYACVGNLDGEEDCLAAGQNLRIAMRAFLALKLGDGDRVAASGGNSL
jgi:hypothetical protein